MHLLRGGAGEPVLFLHAAGGAGTWLPFHSQLADAGFEVIAPDHPGFGKSDEFPEAEAIDDLVFHYLDVLDALGLERPHVVGASFGGWIAAELAVYAPHRIGSLRLLSAAGLRLPEHPVDGPLPDAAGQAGRDAVPQSAAVRRRPSRKHRRPAPRRTWTRSSPRTGRRPRSPGSAGCRSSTTRSWSGGSAGSPRRPWSSRPPMTG